MADYFTQFSCMFDVGTAENAKQALLIYQRLADEMEEAEGCDLGFELEPDPDCSPGALWISADGGGDPEHVIAFVLACAEAFDLTGRWGFAWALSCSKPRLDAFGGGAQVLDLERRESLTWLDCDHWLKGELDAGVEETAADGGATAMAGPEPPGDDPSAAGVAPTPAAT